MDSIKWILGADSSQVRAEMANTINVVNSGSAAMVNSINRVDAAHGNLLKSTPKVASQMSHLFRTMLHGGDGLTLLSAALEATTKSLKFGLPLAAAGYLGVTGIQKVVEMRAEWNKLNEELDRAAKPRAPFDTKPIEEDLKERRDTLKKAEDVKKEQEKNPWITGTNWIRNSAMAVGGWFNGMTSRDSPDYRNTGSMAGGAESLAQAKFRAKPYDTSWSTAFREGQAPDRTASNAMRQSKSDEEIREEKIKAAKEMTDRIEAEKKAAEASKRISDLAEKKSDSMKFSLAELAAKGRDTAPDDDSRAGAGKLAKRAMKEEELARKEMLAEHYDQAGEHQKRADAIKNSIVPLKDSEKDFLTAIERAQVFQKIEENTRKQFVNR